MIVRKGHFHTLLSIALIYLISANQALGQESDSIEVKLEAINLSEDVSVFSTGQDEMLVLGYLVNTAENLEEHTYSKKIPFSDSVRTHEFNWRKKDATSVTKLLIILLEQDESASLERLDPVIRLYYKELFKAYSANDYATIEKYLGDEDLLGFKYTPIDKPISTTFRFSGFHKVDKYEYAVEIKYR